MESGKYDWPSETEQRWRHVTNYSIIDFSNRLTNLFDKDCLGNSLKLNGLLLPRPGELLDLVPYNVFVKSFSIDFGKTPIDSNRGVWIEGDDLVWYHLELPSKDYFSIAVQMQKITVGFFNIYDALIFSEFEIGFNEANLQYVCMRPIQEVYATIGKTLDKNYLIKNYNFVLDHLKSTIDFRKSVVLKESIRSFGDNELDG